MKNGEPGEHALRGAEDICKRQSTLVRIPRPERRGGERALPRVLGEPEDQRGVDHPDERRGAFDGGALASRRIREAQELLEVPEADLDGPSFGVRLEDLGDAHRGGHGEEHPQADGSLSDLYDDDAQQPRCARSVPLRAVCLVADLALPAIQGSVAGLPGVALVAGKWLGLGQRVSTGAWTAALLAPP